ncbi:hypothetical protein HPB47_021722 [Ixodes persulcatus]|uniref:Uncharacterized protein n=1 Tax=Ixodes persulcatus TaxID=34615 RepID=A0AC60QF42_IXOPE|nr:hypothetical protein HPB47_021722 [Ixodes persulcatus]
MSQRPLHTPTSFLLGGVTFLEERAGRAMAPRTETTTITTTETRSKVDDDVAGVPAVDPIRSKPEPLEIIWINVFKILVIHLMALYGAYVAVTAAQWKTLLFTLFYIVCSGLSVTAGAHRLWSHRSYKAKLPLRTLLMLFNCMAGQNDIYDWVRDHRVHHKYSETDADPHNVNRGFFFAHVGWLMCRKHPEVTKKGKAIDCADVYNDPVVRFQMRYHIPMTILFCFIMPTVIPHRYWGEAKWNSFFVAAILRWVFQLNSTWLVNSAAHIWGQKPYDKAISPSENWLVSVLAIGEGFHNYHHTRAPPPRRQSCSGSFSADYNCWHFVEPQIHRRHAVPHTPPQTTAGHRQQNHVIPVQVPRDACAAPHSDGYRRSVRERSERERRPRNEPADQATALSFNHPISRALERALESAQKEPREFAICDPPRRIRDEELAKAKTSTVKRMAFPRTMFARSGCYKASETIQGGVCVTLPWRGEQRRAESLVESAASGRKVKRSIHRSKLGFLGGAILTSVEPSTLIRAFGRI